LISTETFAKPISDAARRVRSRLPRSNTIEIEDLVQVGWERVTRYLAGHDGPVSEVLVFITARQGMLEEAARWGGNAWQPDQRGKSRRIGPPPRLTGYHEWMRSVPCPDIELWIDIKRTLLAMPLREAASWYSRHVLDEPVGKLAPEFGVGRGRVCQYEIAARARLREVASGGEPIRQSSARIFGTARLRLDQVVRQRYAELRQLGASTKQATRGAKSPNCYASAVRQLQATPADQFTHLRRRGMRPIAKCGPATVAP
jgi:hypothetical protein